MIKLLSANHSLMRRLMIGLLITAIIPLTGFALFNLHNFEKVLTQTILDNMEFVATRKAFKIKHYVEDSRAQLDSLSYVPDVLVFFDELKKNYYAKEGIHSAAYLKSDLKTRTLLNQITSNYDYYDLFLIDASGEVIFSLKHEGDFATNLQTGRFKNTGLAEGFRESMDFLTTEFSTSFSYEPSKGALSAFITTPLLRNGLPVGVLVAQTNLDEYLQILLGRGGLGETGEAIMARVSESGKPVFVTPLRYSENSRTDVAIASPMRMALHGDHGKGISIDYAGKENVAVWQYLPDFHLGLVVKITTEEAFAPFRQMQLYTFSWLGALIALVIMTAWLIGRSIVRPVRDLIDITDKISKGDLNQRVLLNYQDDEFVELARTFNHMTGQVKESYDLLEARVEARTFELNALNNELKISQTNLSRAQKVAKICSWYIDAENTLCWSDETYEILGVEHNQLITNDDFLNHIHPEDRCEADKSWQDAQQSGCYDLVHRIIANGVVKWVHSQAEFILDSQEMMYAMGTIQDITEQKQIEMAMRESEIRFRRIFERASIGIVLTGENGHFLQANQFFLDLTGFSWAELEGVNYSTLTHKDDSTLELPLLQAILDNEADFYRIEERYLNKSGAIIWVDVNMTVIRNDKNQPVNFVGLVMDITERKNSEAQLIEAKHIAENANQAKSVFLANMSHEIRTPMNAILGLTQLVLETELNYRQRDFLTKVYSSSKALLSILNDVLDYSKIEAGRLDIESVPCNLEIILTNVADLFSAQLAEKGLELFLDIDPITSYIILSDPLRISQILTNLLSNAVKFTEAGEIQIKVKPLRTQGNEQTLQFSVCDTGIGLSTQQIDQLFQPFIQADNSISRKYGGTGLGLTISYRLVSLMNGEMSVSSVQNEGSTFSFTIDVKLPEEVEDSLVELQKLKGQRVLVVDDQLTSVIILKTLLEAWGLEVETALSGQEALDKIHSCQNAHDSFDSVLLDWHMPNIDGLDVATQLRECPSYGDSLVIIMVTAYDKQELFIKSAELNITNILTKPIIPSKLFNALLDNPNHPVHLHQSRKIKKGEKVLLGMRVLLVEDHKINQQVATEFLTSRGANVTIANQGIEAISHFKNAEFDVILMDLHMPEMDGLEAARQIRRLPKGDVVPIIAMTAAVMAEDRANCLDAGMVDFIAKPVQIEQLIQVLCHWVKKEFYDIEIEPKSEQTTHSTLDIAAALKRLNGNSVLLSRLLDDFAREHAQTVEQLNSLLGNQELETAAKLLHSIKGVSANLGANSLSQNASQLEKQIKDEVELTALPLFTTAMQETFEMIEELKHAKLVITTESGNVLSSQELLLSLEALRPYLENSDFLPESLLDLLKAIKSENPIKTLLNTLWSQLDAFDYNGALATLEQLITLVSESTS